MAAAESRYAHYESTKLFSVARKGLYSTSPPGKRLIDAKRGRGARNDNSVTMYIHDVNNSSVHNYFWWRLLVALRRSFFQAPIEKGTNAYDSALAAATLPTSSELSTQYLKRTLPSQDSENLLHHSCALQVIPAYETKLNQSESHASIYIDYLTLSISFYLFLPTHWKLIETSWFDCSWLKW